MRRLLMLAILVTPLCASAEYLDVIQVKLKERCTPATYVAIKNDFNEHWGKGHGYRAEIAQPVQSNDLVSVFWIGHAASAESFGKALDTRGSGIGTGARLVLRRRGAIFRLSAHFGRVDMPGLATAPQFAELLVKIGDDCLSAVLACAARGSDLRCVPERSALLHGHVSTAARRPLPGTMLTAFDDSRLESVSVFAQEDGRFVFPRLRPGTYRLRARLLGWQEVELPVTLAGRKVTIQNFSLTPIPD